MLTDIHLDSPIMMVATPLFGVTAKGTEVLAGTGVVIQPQLILTARHVVDDFVEKFCRDAPPGPRATPDGIAGSIYGFVRSVTGGWISFRVLKISASENSDLALLTVAASEDEKANWACPSIQLTPPRVGQSINAFGFPGTGLELRSDINEEADGRIVLWPSATEGTVLEIHDRERDRFLMPFPCFRTDAQFDGAMSGGPVFLDGRLCGIICKGYDFKDTAEVPIGYVASLWMALPLDAYGLTESGELEPRMLIDLLTTQQAADLGNFSISRSGPKEISIRTVTPRSVTFTVVFPRQSSEVTSVSISTFR